MREIPECLNRRYRALDELIKELSAAAPDSACPSHENSQIGIKLMCDFWNILKDDPDCNLPAEVQQRMCTGKEGPGVFGPHHGTCYATGKDFEKCDDRRRDCSTNRVRHITAPTEPRRYGCGQKTDSAGNDKIPLSKVLCNLKEAASFDKQCNVRVGELVAAQKELTEQIQTLEKREKDGVMLLKQADCMWSCMEDAYKKKLADSKERQKDLFKELKQVEISNNKWRKNKKDLDFQVVNINKCHSDIVESINQKKNDIKVMNMEIEDLSKRVQNNVKDINIAKTSWKSKKDASDAKIANIAQELAKIQKKVTAEQQFKYNKEQEGSNYVKDAREDLQKICRVLLQKKLENEDLIAEKEALLQEIDLLKQTCDNCKEKCTNKEKKIADEMKKIDEEAAQYKAKCIRCHQCSDTTDVRKFCTDCPRCLAERDCLYEDGHCSPDHTMDCVCMSVKQKFLDNVFDNMYTVLERQVKTCPGKAVADCILHCLKRSRNGKLNQETRKVVQDFILSTVKKNLNLTIVGGAVKTRCEMDPETYQQLMLCLKEVNATRPKKEDKGTPSKKASCRRWGGTSECNCPKGPKACICLKKAPQPPKDPHSCGLQEQTEESDDVKTCPQREALACSTDCGMLGLPIPEAAGWRRESCQGQSCPFSNNMRAAQCVLGPESIASGPKPHPAPPIIPKFLTENMATCTCGGKAIKPCPCCEDAKHVKAEVKENCDKSTCANFGKQKKNHEVQSDQNIILPKHQKERKIPENTPNKKTKKEHLKIAIENESGQANHELAELTETKSGRLAMELEEHVIELIEKKSKEDTFLFVSLRRTDSGNMLIDFDTKEKEFTQRVTVRRTPSGTRLLDMNKNMINVLKDTLSNEKPDMSLSSSIQLSPSTKKLDSDKAQPLQSIEKETDKLAIKEGLDCTCPKAISNSKLSELDNKKYDVYHPGPPLPVNTKPGKDTIDVYLPKKLDCTCPKTISNSKLSELDSKKYDVYHPGPPLSVNIKPGKDTIDVYLPKKLDCTCPKAISNSKLSEFDSKEDDMYHPDPPLPVNTKPGKDTIHVCLPKKLDCTCPKSISYSKLSELDSKKYDVYHPGPRLPVNTKPGKIIVDVYLPKKLDCTCPKTISNSKLSEFDSKEYDMYHPEPPLSVNTKPGKDTIHVCLPKKLDCTCPKSISYSKLSELDSKKYDVYHPGPPLPVNIKPGKEIIDVYLPKKLDCICPKTISNSKLLELDSTEYDVYHPDPPLPVNTKPGKDTIHVCLPKKLDCICPKSISNSKLSELDSKKYDVYHPGPPLPLNTKPGKEIIDVYLPKKLDCTCPKTISNSKLSELDNKIYDMYHPGPLLPLNTKPGKEIIDMYLPKKLDCTCPKTDPNLVCCNLPSKLDLSANDIKTDPHLHQKKTNTIKIERTSSKTDPNAICCKLYECTCHTVPPITCIKPKTKITNKEKPECTCSKATSYSVCCKLKSEVNIALDFTNSWKSVTSKGGLAMNESLLLSEFKELYKQGNTNIPVIIQGKSGVLQMLHTGVTRTPSGVIAIYSRRLSLLRDISFEEKEYPVSLSKTVSGTYLVNCDRHNSTPNASLRKTPSGGTLLVPKLNVIKEQKRREFEIEEFFKLKLSGVKEYPIELPAVLKRTLSGNYVIILDKEFENRYRQTMNQYIGDNSECIVDLNKTNSGSYIIQLGERVKCKNNALLVKSISGNIKILVHGPEFESIKQPMSIESSSTKGFKEPISKLPASSREFHRGNLRKSKYLENKASSDTELIDNVKEKLESHKHLLSQPSAILKKTDSGQYAVVLNKESKKAFIHNLQSYLTTNSHDMVPIKRSDSGEIVINFNNNDKQKGHYGSLKITTSGNIYVVVDEEAIEDMSKKFIKKDVSSNLADAKAKNLTKRFNNTRNKAVTTTCNGKLDDYSCDLSKCVCDELESDTMNWFQDNTAKQDCTTIWKNGAGGVDDFYAKKLNNVKKITPRDTSLKRTLVKKNENIEQCYYVLDTVRTHCKYRRDPDCNKILGLSRLGNNTEYNKKNTAMDFRANKSRQVFNSFSFSRTPPKLPPF